MAAGGACATRLHVGDPSHGGHGADLELRDVWLVVVASHWRCHHVGLQVAEVGLFASDSLTAAIQMLVEVTRDVT